MATTYSAAADGRTPRRVSNYEAAGREQHFPFKLYAMLEHAADSEHSSVVSWVKGGHAFAIHNKDDFLKHIVPRFFKQTQYRSFTRQLNIWGFQRFSTDCSSVWGHKDFIRGQKERLGSIERIEIKGELNKNKNRLNIKSFKLESSQSRERPPSALQRRPSSVASSASPAEYTEGSLSSDFWESPLSVLPRTVSTAVSIPAEISPIEPSMWQNLANGLVDDGNQWQFQAYPMPMSAVDSYTTSAQQRVKPDQHVMQPTTGEDLLLLLSGIFEPEESSQDYDLSSSLSLNESSDLMNPINF